MFILKKTNVKNIFLIAFILLQLFGYKPVEGAINCVQCGKGTTKCSGSDKPTSCTDDKITKCYAQIGTTGSIERGCADADKEKECTANKKCRITDNEKNNQLICKKCEGSDASCSQTDMNSTDDKYQFCDAGVTKCITKVENKLVVRRCATADDATQCTDGNTCKICSTDICNTGIFPPERINCYQCSNCNDVTAAGVDLKPCLNYVEKDECYTKGDNETNIVRGCKSDSNGNQCSSSAVGCAFCDKDKCNSFKYKRDQVLKCYQCTGNITNADCFKEQTSKNFSNCEKQILYNESDYCYTHYEGVKIQRGCLHDNSALTVDECKDGDGNVCNKCNQADGCNNKTIEFSCIICRSDLEKKCWNDATNLQGSNCRTGPSSPAEGCFHGIWNGVAIRGCVADASKQVQEICKDENNRQCKICYEKDCNTKTSSGAINGFSYALILTVLMALWELK